MPPTVRSCSWCHRMNRVDLGPATCPDCGHRADLPRLECDCPACRPDWRVVGTLPGELLEGDPD